MNQFFQIFSFSPEFSPQERVKVVRASRVIGPAIDLIAVRDQRQRSPGQGIAALLPP